jgi:hypothetical protein
MTTQVGVVAAESAGKSRARAIAAARGEGVLLTKLTPAAVRSELVVRERLHATIRDRADGRLSARHFGSDRDHCGCRQLGQPARGDASCSLFLELVFGDPTGFPRNPQT